MSTKPQILVVVATYNEIDNLPRLVDAVFQHAPDCELLVIDDNSPDGTGKWCDQQAEQDQRLHCLHRSGKLGLGTATLAGLRYAVEHRYDYVINMDGDFSHHPKYLPELIAGLNDTSQGKLDVMIGSRYQPGGGIDGWPWQRHLMSRGINLFARLLLGLKTKDCSGSFRCYRTDKLAEIDFDQFRSRGYSVYEEILWRLRRVGARFGEIPIVFTDREKGSSKINAREAVTSLWIIFRLGVKNRLGF